MRIDGRDYRTIWLDVDGRRVHVIDQTLLPHRVQTRVLADSSEAARAIADMIVRGAPLIGVTGAYGLALAVAEDPSDAAIDAAYEELLATRPTASNLRWALDRLRSVLAQTPIGERRSSAYAEASAIAEEDVVACASIGDHGAGIIKDIFARKGRRLNILTHCNAGWLATIDWGTATAPVYRAQEAGIPVHVWVDETRPRSQGAALTAYELAEQGVPHTVIVDNLGGHLMQHGRVDLCIVGTDRTTRTGDVCNKIGTYLKALAAHDNGVPFYVALPSTTIDWRIGDGVREIPIEERSGDEVSWVAGRTDDGRIERVRVTPATSPALNYGFDVTPARLVTGLVTERGVAPASAEGLAGLFPEAA